MKKMKASFVGIMPRNVSEEEQWNNLKELAKLGYRATENASGLVFGRGDESGWEDRLKRLQSIGLEPVDIGLHNGEAVRTQGSAYMIDHAHRLGVDKAVMYHGAAYYRKDGRTVTYDQVMNEIELLQATALECKKEGIKFCYHNHDHEFTTYFNGMAVYDMLLAYAPDMYMELDCGWVTYAGLYAPDVIRKLGDKIALMHFKDFLPGGPVKHTVFQLDPTGEKKFNMPNFCALGAGMLPVYECLKACAEIGVEIVNAEQDFEHTLKGMDILRCDYYIMKESGYIL